MRDVAHAREEEGASPFFPSNGAGTLAHQFRKRLFDDDGSDLSVVDGARDDPGDGDAIEFDVPIARK